MSLPPQTSTSASPLDTAFVADREMFWNRFTSFTKGSVIAIVILLLGMLVFLA